MVKLPVILSLCLIVAAAAPSSFAADAKPAVKPAAAPASKPADKPVVPTVQKPEPLNWPVIKSWYDKGQDARAIRAAKLLGRPIAIAWSMEGRERSLARKLKASSIPRYFVCLTVTSRPARKSDKKDADTTNPFLKKVYESSGLAEYPKPPCLFVATWDGKFLGIINKLPDSQRSEWKKRKVEILRKYRAETTAAATEISRVKKLLGKDVPPNRKELIAAERQKIKTAQQTSQAEMRTLQEEMARANADVTNVLATYGKLLKESQARDAWKGLIAARKLWHKGKYDEAMKYYRAAMSVAKVNSSMEIAVELNKDVAAIDHRGAKQLRVFEEHFEKGELDKAGAGVRKIHSAYEGFETAEKAKALFESIRTAQGGRPVATEDIEKEPVDKPAARPAANDDKKNDDEKKDDDGNNKKGEDDEDYEDDF